MNSKKKSKKKLRIALVAPLWITIPPEKYGGIERIIASLADELSSKGHDVTLFASPGSKTKAKLISVFEKPLLEAKIKWSDNTWNLRNLSLAYEMANEGKFDIVHTHLDVWDLFFSNLSKVPSVQTMHNPLLEKSRGKSSRHMLYEKLKDNFNVAFISKKAKELSGLEFPKSRVIYNGIDMEKFSFNPRPNGYLAWAARVDKYKGIENAIEIAKKSGMPLKLAGRIDKSKRRYFNTVIKPQLSGDIEYLGELNSEEITEFYANAKGFLYPIEWEEPFGLVVAEAMACGTPVIAYNRGSMPELIEDGKTGYLVDDIKGAVEAVKKLDSLDRRYIRDYVQKRFSDNVMVDAYEKFYFDILKDNK